MRSLDVTAENLKNQQNVVSEEVRVNVLNQPHGAFDWIEIWERANTNWHNAHDFYGDLDELEAATIEDVRSVLQDLLRAEQRGARRRRRHHGGRGQASGGEALRVDPAAAAAGRPPISPSRRRPPPKSSHAHRQAGAHAGDRGGVAPAAADDEGLLRVERARSAAQQRRQRADVSQAGARGPARDVEPGRLQLPGPNWDMKGPMLYTMRVDYFNDKTADQVVAAIETRARRRAQEGHHRRRAAQAKTAMRSAFLDDTRKRRHAAVWPRQPARLFALFDDDPRPHQHHPRRDRQGDAGRREGAPRTMAGAREPHVDRQPAGGQAARRREVCDDPSAFAASQLGAAMSVRCRLPCDAAAVRRPLPKPESAPSSRSRRPRASSARWRTACR